MKNGIPETFDEALSIGYQTADTTYQRGYVSRKIDIGKQKIHIAQGGKRKGQLYVLIPTATTSTYCLRQYLVKEG